MTLTYQILKRGASRATSYNWSSLERVIKTHGLEWTNLVPGASLIVVVVKEVGSRDEALQFRRSFEGDLRLVHRNLPFRLDITF